VQKYNELAAKDKIRYQKEAAAYKEEHPESSDEEERPAKKRKKKDPNAPKKPCSAFFHFSKKMRPRIKEENPTASFGQLGKIIGEQWSKLGADERKVHPLPTPPRLQARDPQCVDRDGRVEPIVD
jgi:hypothetical protein